MDAERLWRGRGATRVFAGSVTALLFAIDLASRGACGLLSPYSENTLGAPAIALHDTFELGPPIRRHAEAIDDDIADLVYAVARAQAPIDPDRMKRRVKPRSADTKGPNHPWRSQHSKARL